MEITVNGQKRDYFGPPNVAGLLDSLGVSPRPVIVERNLRLVPRNELHEEPVCDGDNIEIIRFVGGG